MSSNFIVVGISACHAKFDIAVIDAIKLPLLNFSNFSIAKLVVIKLVRV